MTTQRRLKIALIGLGRLGAIRARILAHQQPRIEFVAACDTKPGAAEWAAANLPSSVTFYADPEDCLRNSGAEAVLISTATATHAPLILLGLDLGLVRALSPPSLSRLIHRHGKRRTWHLTAGSMSCVKSPSRSTFSRLSR